MYYRQMSKGSRQPPDRAGSSYRIAPLTPRHLSRTATVFAQSFPNTLLAALGPSFLRELLASYVHLPGGCGYVCLDGEEVVGFVVGSEDSGQHRRTLLRQRWAPLMLRALHRLATSPQLARLLARYLFFHLSSSPLSGRRRQEEADVIPPASLTLVAVAPEHRRRGIGDRLTRAFLREMASRGTDRVKLAVSVSNEAALSLYVKQGWRVAGCYRSSEDRLAYRLIYEVASPATREDRAA